MEYSSARRKDGKMDTAITIRGDSERKPRFVVPTAYLLRYEENFKASSEQ